MAMEKVMKNFLNFCLIVLILCGCSTKEEIQRPIILPDFSKPTVSPTNSSIPDNIEKAERDYANVSASQSITAQIKEKFLFYPTDIIINLDTKSIRWVADCGVGLDLDIFTEQDQEAYVKLHRSIYEGTLTEISENIYSAKGEFMPTMLSKNSPISENVDFYLILKDRNTYIVLEEMSLDDLKKYNSDSYYYWHEKTEE